MVVDELAVEPAADVAAAQLDFQVMPFPGLDGAADAVLRVVEADVEVFVVPAAEIPAGAVLLVTEMEESEEALAAGEFAGF